MRIFLYLFVLVFEKEEFFMRTAQTIDESSSISIRLPNRLLGRIDRFIRWFEKEFPGLSIGRPDVVRMAVERLTEKIPHQKGLLDRLEQDLPTAQMKSIRYFSDDEIKGFEEEDKISPALLKKAKAALKKK